VQDLATKKVMITSQNHGFAVDPATLPAHVRPTHVSLFDGSLQGIELTDSPAFSFQGHPEASPGPHDLLPLFERVTQAMIRRLQTQLRERARAVNGGRVE
jgi:carbamoyl-phosphate synthase small subunit